MVPGRLGQASFSFAFSSTAPFARPVCPKSRSRPTQPNRLVGVSARQSYTTTLLTVDMSDDDEEDDDRH
jgi:hypothetical protein